MLLPNLVRAVDISYDIDFDHGAVHVVGGKKVNVMEEGCDIRKRLSRAGLRLAIIYLIFGLIRSTLQVSYHNVQFGVLFILKMSSEIRALVSLIDDAQRIVHDLKR